jgi:hypothetical protein
MLVLALAAVLCGYGVHTTTTSKVTLRSCFSYFPGFICRTDAERHAMCKTVEGAWNMVGGSAGKSFSITCGVNGHGTFKKSDLSTSGTCQLGNSAQEGSQEWWQVHCRHWVTQWRYQTRSSVMGIKNGDFWENKHNLDAKKGSNYTTNIPFKSAKRASITPVTASSWQAVPTLVPMAIALVVLMRAFEV